ncbi:rhodanese-like domain-containing protein [Thalassotalea piscium]|uniref:Rhodanese-related sulfurtransferase n=1 Tax=Thalassotalea piscium TaxID=1230533 RepID=A0A7X0NHR1_9GAMM|nr:rhodanese-like domain-containing protein [Thalassotalea piscium]MBB6543686.1 rhodanese-related sulfurtransferase [Thalassotalea piscium]
MKGLFLLVLITFVFISASVIAADVPEVTQQQVLSLKAAEKAPKFIILDVRTPQEYAEQHIDGAINVSHTDIENNLSMLSQYKDTMVIVHCRSGKRADIAENILLKNGFNQIKHLAGDMNGWVAAGLPTIKQ